VASVGHAVTPATARQRRRTSSRATWALLRRSRRSEARSPRGCTTRPRPHPAERSDRPRHPRGCTTRPRPHPAERSDHPRHPRGCTTRPRPHPAERSDHPRHPRGCTTRPRPHPAERSLHPRHPRGCTTRPRPHPAERSDHPRHPRGCTTRPRPHPAERSDHPRHPPAHCRLSRKVIARTRSASTSVGAYCPSLFDDVGVSRARGDASGGAPALGRPRPARRRRSCRGGRHGGRASWVRGRA